MAGFSVIYIGAAVQLYGWHFGDSSLVYANIINLSARIVYAVFFVSAFFSANNARSVLAWRNALPGYSLSTACCVSWAVVRQSARRLDIPGTVARSGAGISVLMNKNVLVHVATGGVFGVLCLGVWWYTEGRQHLALSRARPKTE